jgi:pimeloyl-ACP methyl ester carboxylesterase
MLPSIRYARTSDGVTIAYTVLGDGPTLVSMPSGLLSNLLAQRRVPSIARAYERLAQHMRLVLYDGRGTGSSQRDVDDVGLEAMVRDLEAVVEHARLETFALLGYYFTAPAAIAYAARNPDRVTNVAVFGGSLRVERMFSAPFSQALLTLIERDWEAAIESAAHAWMGWSGTADERLAVEAYRDSATPAVARMLFNAAHDMDVSAEAANVRPPVLVIHRHEERQLPLEVSQEVAAALPDARLLRLEGTSGVLFLQDPDADVDVLLDFLVGADIREVATSSSPTTGPQASGQRQPGVFISCSERQKEALARPFKDLLAESGVRGYVVSDEPRPDGTWTPEDKVDAYLDMSDAVVVFATADLESGDDRYTRPNIGDEIGRARSKPHLRNRVCVLKEHGVTLPSNINPAYETLDVANRDDAFRRALLQLHAWGLTAAGSDIAAETRG